MHINVFQGDAFRVSELTEAIQTLPYAPTRIGQLGLFKTSGISTTDIAVEMRAGVLTLVPAADRGAPGAVKSIQKRNMRNFSAIHLPQRCAVIADEVQNLRAFGSETETETAMGLLQEKIAVCTQDLDVTIEWQRMGAIKGIILDADGTTPLLNLFTEFGVSQIVIDMNLDNASTSIMTLALSIKRSMEAELGALMYTGVRVLCGAAFFTAFVTHPEVVEAYRIYNQSSFLRADNRKGFEFAEIIWEEVRGSVGGAAMVATDEAYAVPEGIPDMFITKYAPANYMETVNTRGLPRYAKTRMMDFDKGVDCEVQSNPIHYTSRPRAVIKLVRT